MGVQKFFGELKRRNVYKVAAVYAVVAWLLIQAGSILFPTFEAPGWVMKVFVTVIAAGFPIALILAWAFELTPEGMKRTENVSPDEILPEWSRRKLATFIVSVGLVSAGLLIFQLWRTRSLSGATHLSQKSIAVLPFENRSHDPENAYFTEGVQDEILTRLAKVADLKVISRTSTQGFKSVPENLPQIAKQLGVAHILEGSVQKSEDRVRVNVQLINAATDAHLWAESFDRKLTDIFAVESEIAKNIADKLQARLTGSEEHAMAARPTENTEAYQLYLKGRFFWNKRTGDGLKKALDYFNQAVAADPKYALAYAGISDVYQLLPNYSADAPKDCLPKAEAAAKKALELDNTLAEAHSSLASVLTQRFEFTEAEKEFKRAIEMNPNYATAHQWYSDSVLAPTERLQEALAEMKRALELDPLSPIINGELALAYETVDRYDEAIEQFHRTIELEPGFYKARLWLGNALAVHGDLAGAIAEYQKAGKLSDDPGIPAGLAWAYAALGNKKEAAKILDQLQERSKHQYVPAAIFSMLYLALGNKDEAMRWLEKSYQDGAGIDLQGIRLDRRMAPLHGDPRFEKLISLIFGPQKKASPSEKPKP
jgi:TolB-like protein/Flp pilus assembly protein TadD